LKLLRDKQFWKFDDWKFTPKNSFYMKSGSLIMATLLAAFMLLGTKTSAQLNYVMEKSHKDFVARYPQARNIVWKNGASSYAASFRLNDSNFIAHYSKDGTWQYIEKAIDSTEFPEAVRISVSNSHNPGWKTVSRAYIETRNKKKFYRIELKKGKSKQYIFYDSHGKEVRRTQPKN
jgi:hypothetical protein